MASDKKLRDETPEEKKLLLASKYLVGLLSVLEKLLADKNTDNQ